MSRTAPSPRPHRRRAARAFAVAAAGAALGLALLGAPARSDSDGPDYWRVVGVRAGDVLNIRSGPGTEHPKVGEIPASADGIRNDGCKGRLNIVEWEKATPAERTAAFRRVWCQIAYRGVKGWVAGRFLAEGNKP
jgi:uncharacterized protein YgiM (DUF1202 family)